MSVLRSSSCLLLLAVLCSVASGVRVAPPASTSFLETMEKSDAVSNVLKAKLDSTWQRLPASAEKRVDEFGLPLDNEVGPVEGAAPFALLETNAGAEAEAEAEQEQGEATPGVVVPDFDSWLPTKLRSLLKEVDASHQISTHPERLSEEDPDAINFLETATKINRAAAGSQLTAAALSKLRLSTSLKAQVLALVQARAEVKAASAARVAHYEKFFAALHAANSDAADAKRDGDAADRDSALKQASDMDASLGGSDTEKDNDGHEFIQHPLSPPWGQGSEQEWRKVHTYNDQQLTGRPSKSRGPLDVYVVSTEGLNDGRTQDAGPVRPPTPPGQSVESVNAASSGVGIARAAPRPQYGEQVGTRASASLYEQALVNPAAKRLHHKLKPVPVQAILPIRAHLVDEVKPKIVTPADAEDELLRLQREYGM